jgi:hypothetical protein
MFAVPELNVATAEVLEGYLAPVLGWAINHCNDGAIWLRTPQECATDCAAKASCNSFDYWVLHNTCYLSSCTRETAPEGDWTVWPEWIYYEKKTAAMNSQASDLVIGSKSVMVEGGFTQQPEMNGVYTADSTKDIGGKVTMWHSSGEFYLFWCSVDSLFGIAPRSTFENNRAGKCFFNAHTDGANKNDLLTAESWNEFINGVFTPIGSAAVVVCPNPAPAFTYSFPNEWTGTCRKPLSRTEVESCASKCPCTGQRAPATEFGITNCCEGTFNKNGGGACLVWRAGCVAGQFQSQQPSATQDRICSGCVAGQFSTASNAGGCTNWRLECGPGEYQAVVPTKTRDRVCQPCPDGSLMTAETHAEPECVAWDDCREAIVASFEVITGTGTAHPVCRPLTVCTDSQREVAPPTATSDRKCGDTTSTTTVTTVTSTTSATSSTATETTSTITTATETTTTATATTTSATSTTTTTFTTIKSSASSITVSASVAVGFGVLFLLVLLAVLFFNIRRRCTQHGQSCSPSDVTKGSTTRGTPPV